MPADKPLRRLTLRQLMAAAEKCTRDLAEYCQTQFLPRAADIRELSRPVRRRSHYPTMLAVQNSLRKINDASDDLKKLVENLQEHLQAIREHATRDRVSR